VGLWTNGSLLGLDDLWIAQTIAWPEDDPEPTDDEPGCGCAEGHGHPGGWLLVPGFLLMRGRRTRTSVEARARARSPVFSRSGRGVS
jgi:hypothetical protein